jgi:hypothetical protein
MVAIQSDGWVDDYRPNTIIPVQRIIDLKTLLTQHLQPWLPVCLIQHLQPWLLACLAQEGCQITRIDLDCSAGSIAW